MKELLERIAEMPRFLDVAVDAAGQDQVSVRGPGEAFSIREQACHLRDVEREGYLVRVRRILAEDVPDLAGFDGAAVAADRDYNSQDARVAARDFAIARAEVVSILTRATPAELAREATIFGKRITLSELAAMIDEHDRGHREEIGALAPMESR
jgi:hypothetical protein